MKIAIVAPCPVPFMVGGAEKLWWGLASHFNERTVHQAEIIKLPTREHDLVSLISGYEAFAALDLSGFDLVISGKYPAWMVEHPRHVCYMLHRLRGLYDCYYGVEQLSAEVAGNSAVAALRRFLSRSRGSRSALPEFFGRWRELASSPTKPAGLLDFPGPLAREMVRWLDDIGLAPGAIARYAAISSTVAQRPGYFPEGVQVSVAYPPPHRTMVPGERFEHFYTVSRLDHIKRVELIVRAMRLVKTDLPLLVGGTGPEEGRIRELAAQDPRVRLVGHQSDADVLESYRNSIAVPFVPWQEDYGLIAVEAMQCGKPVITAKDSGGPCELVDDGVNGFVCEDSAESLARAMQRFADDPALARAMGRTARERSARITWGSVADALLADAPPRVVSAPAQGARKLVVASTFAIHPPRHGGQVRSYNIYRALAPEFETVIVSFAPSAAAAFDGEIAPGVREVRVPMSPEHERREKKIEAEAGTPVTDVLMPELHSLTPRYAEALEREARGACAAVASHPYLYPALRVLGLPIWYEAQDFELRLKRPLFEKLARGERLVRAVHDVDRACATAAEVILCASADDAAELVREFGVRRERILDVPNGTDVGRIPFAGPEDRAALKRRMGIAENFIALFMGSGHWPNIEAVKRIFEFAAALPGVAFAVMGSVCYAFDERLKPQNVLFLGEVDDVTRNLCLQAFDAALNPVEHGSGTNIKMLDYFAAGLPVISTERGARGLDLDAETQCLIRGIDAFPAAIGELMGEGAAAAAGRALAARTLVEERYDWDSIVARVKPALVAIADRVAADSTRAERRARAAG